MALVLDPSDGIGGTRRNGVVGAVPSLYGAQPVPRPHAPPQPWHQRSTNLGPGAQSAQTTRTTNNTNNNPRRSAWNRGNGSGKKSGAGQSSNNVPPNSLNLGSGGQAVAQSEGSYQPPRNRNARRANNNAPQTPNQAPPNGGPNRRRPRRNGNQGGQGPNNQSNAANTNPSNATNDTQAVDPVTGQPISKRAAARRRAKARKAAARAEAQQQQQGTQNGTRVTQPQSRPQTRPQVQPQPQTQPQVQPEPPQLNGSSGQAVSGRAAQIPLQQPRPDVVSPNNGASGSAARSTAPRPPEPTIRTPAASSTTVPAPLRNHATAFPQYRAFSTRPTTAFPAQLRFGANNQGDDSDNDPDDVVGDTLARMGIAVTPARRPASRDATTRPAAVRAPAVRAPAVRAPPPRPRVATSPCSICLDEPDEFPRLRPTLRCTHPSTICAPCLEQHISHAVQSQGLTTLTCPDPQCRQSLEYGDVIRGAKGNRACLNRYETLLLRRMLENEPNFVRCKNPTCDSGQVHESGAAAPIVICQACRARSCFTHDVPWHVGLTCAQYDAQRAGRAREDQASQAYIDRHAKICPNPCCGRRIEKSEGCDHMTCRRPVGCGHEFCWVCLADYDPIRREGNHRHAPTCRYYAAIERQDPLQAFRMRVEALERAREERERILARIRAQPPPRVAPAPAPARPPQPQPAPTQSWWNWLFG